MSALLDLGERSSMPDVWCPGSSRSLEVTESWLRHRFPRHPYIYFGVSGATLLYEGLKMQRQKSVILPAFICSNFSATVIRAGKDLAHIDADPFTQLPNPEKLIDYLQQKDPANTILLIDHSFGYPFPALADIRRRFPKLLIIEDCARALGVRISGQAAGLASDWLLLSMYKTTRGCTHGAILLARTPLALQAGMAVRSTLRESLSTNAAMRRLYYLWQRATPSFEPLRTNLEFPEWHPIYGLPSKICASRFAAQLKDFDRQISTRGSDAEELIARLSTIDNLMCIKAAEGCRPTGHFVSVRIPGRDKAVMRLRKRGLVVTRTWHTVPAHYRLLSNTFPLGSNASKQLAAGMIHIPMAFFDSRQAQDRLVEEFRRISRLPEYKS